MAKFFIHTDLSRKVREHKFNEKIAEIDVIRKHFKDAGEKNRAED